MSTDMFDLNRKKNKQFDRQKFFQSLSADERKSYWETNRAIGLAAPTDDGFFGEFADRAQGSFISGMRGIGATFNELGMGSGMQNYFDNVLRTNQQWNAPEEQSIAGYIGGALGTGLGSSAIALGATAVGAATGVPHAGAVLGFTAAFSQTFGDNVQRNRAAGYGEEKAYGMAFLESGVDSVIENLPFGIVGKGAKNAGRLYRISKAGKKELLNKIGKKIAAQVGQKEAQNLLWKWAKQTTVSGLGEAGEEGLQYLNSYVNQKLGGDPNAEFSIDELADAMAQGFIGGFGMGGVQNLASVRHDAKMRKALQTEDVAENENIAATPAIDPERANVISAEEADASTPLMNVLVADVADYLGINIGFMDTRPDLAEKQNDKNGAFDPETNTLYINRESYTVNPAQTLGHELKHYIDQNDKQLSKTFDALIKEGSNNAAMLEILNIVENDKVTKTQASKEFSADVFGKLFARPETWQKMAEQLDERTPGMGERFLQALADFYNLIKNFIQQRAGKSPDAEAYLSNVDALQNEAARMLAELRRRNGNSTEIENVVGAKGNTNVETVPVSQINIDAKRFQFKSNTNKLSGVDETNKLGGDWNPRSAGNLYLWEDKNGNLYVVNGHHRLELAQRNGVENINAIIDRETDGVSAEQARRNGVLINILDGQGEVRDYASFVRSEKLSEDEAEAQGVTARVKGRAGFLLGKSGDTLYEAYINEVIPESKAVIIAEIAQGNEAIEYAGIKLATDRKLAGETLRQTLKLAAQNTSGTKSETEQGGLFDMVDDSVLKEWEAIGKLATKHIEDLRAKINSRKSAVKNPEAAREGDIKVGKKAEKLLTQTQQELMRWENYATDAELMAQLREEAGIAPKEVVSETEKTTDKNGQKPTETDNDVVSAKNAQTILDKMREAFANRAERLGKTGKGMLWTDIAREYAEGQVLSKEANASILQEILNMAKEDYQWSESRSVLYAISQNPDFSQNIRKKVESAIKFIDKKIDAQILEQVKDSAVVKENLTTETAATAEKSSEVEKAAPEVKSALHDIPDRSAEIGLTFDQFYEKFAPQLDAYIAKETRQFNTIGNETVQQWYSAAYEAMAKAYRKYNPESGVKITTYASKAVKNAINEIKAGHQQETLARGGRISLDQTNEQGEELSAVVADENSSTRPGETPIDKMELYRAFKAKQTPLNQTILELAEQGKSDYDIGRAKGVGLTTEEVAKRRKKMRSMIIDEGLEFSHKRQRQQINPIIRDGKVREEYQYLLDERKYTPQQLETLQREATEWILSSGGIAPAAEAILNDKAPADPAVAELVRRIIFESDVFAEKVSKKERTKLYKIEQDARSAWGLSGRTMQLDALKMKDVAAVQALLDKLHENMPDEEVQKLRNKIKKSLDIDIYELPDDIVKDKSKLDNILREHLAQKASFTDKIYEYWINAILSGPTTHISNLLGNTANAVYELGIKRFTEALINSVAGRKDGATFGEFKAMLKAFNWENAKKAFVQARDLEVLDASGKFQENNMVAIGGKTGRTVRTFGRFLKASDAFAKALIEPMETAAYAYREGVSQGLEGKSLSQYIQKQLTDSDSSAYEWGRKRALELTFQEDPGSFVNRLLLLKDSGGVTGTALKFFVPFVTSPYNILRQGFRKSPLGAVSFGIETGKAIFGKRKFDGEYVARAAEQLIAWGALMAVAGLSDDDDEVPFITGSPADYGSSKYGFEANKIPPYSIRIGGAWYSYKRIEPLATGLAVIADAIQGWRDARNGKDGMEVIGDFFKKSQRVIREKSFLDGIGELHRAFEDPQNFAKALTNPAKGFIPNIYTQMRLVFDENVQDNKSREKAFTAQWFKDQFVSVTNQAGITSAVPKVDYFGREVNKDDWSDYPLSPLWRLLPVKRINAESNIDPAEKLILNYNNKNFDEQWFPSIPKPTFTVNKQKMYFCGNDYTNFAIDAGKLAHKQIQNAINGGYLNVDNPGKRDIELIKKIFTRARKETRQKYMKSAKTF